MDYPQTADDWDKMILAVQRAADGSRSHEDTQALDCAAEILEALKKRTWTGNSILTGARSGEVLRSIRHGDTYAMRWDEVDLEARVWTVPAVRMKSNRVHQVPLSGRTVEILSGLGQIGPWVFPSVYKTGAPLSEGACEALMRDMGAKPATVHGFRSCFRDWAGDRTSFPRELIEHALSHRVGSAVELAYRRSDALERRRPLMEAWSSFCGAGCNVVALRG